MPRIAATLGVFGLVVLALGLNIVQFPIEYGPVSPPTVAEEPEEPKEIASPPESTQIPKVALKPAPESRARSPRESGRAEVTTPQDRPDSSDRVSRDPGPPNSDAKTGPPMQPREGRVRAALPDESESDSEHHPNYTEDNPGETPEPTTPQAERGTPPEAEKDPAKKPTELGSVPDEKAEPPNDEMPRSSSDFADAPQVPTEQNRVPVADGIYNPLEPDRDSALKPHSSAKAMPNDPPVSAAPTTALAGPPYAKAVPANVTADRSMVPIEHHTKDATEESDSPKQVLRLPSVDSVWPAVPTDQPLGHGWIPAESYPKTQPPDE